MGQVRSLPLLGPRWGPGAFCPLCPGPAAGSGRPELGLGPALRTGFRAGWPGDLAFVILGLSVLSREEESPFSANPWDGSAPGSSLQAGRFSSPHRGHERVCDQGKDFCKDVRLPFIRPRIFNVLREKPESGAFRNWGCGEGPASLKLQLQREDFGIGLENKTEVAFPTL